MHKILRQSQVQSYDRVQFVTIADTMSVGRIHCRFAEGSLELEELGKLIREKAQHDRDAYFSVCEYCYQSSTKEYKIDSDFIHNMTRGKFNMPQLQFRIKNKLSETEIRFSLNSRHTYPISGFPRCLVDDEKSQTSRSH
jgi:hypothetical protein